jgi:hypothetical protein
VAPQCQLGDHDGITDKETADEEHYDKNGSAIFTRDIGKTPDGAQSDS